MKKIIYEFAKFAKETLLFLRYVTSIQLMIADKDGNIENVLHVEMADTQQRTQSVWRTFIGKGLSAGQTTTSKSSRGSSVARRSASSTKNAGVTSTDTFYRYLQRLNQTRLPIGIRSIKIKSHFVERKEMENGPGTGSGTKAVTGSQPGSPQNGQSKSTKISTVGKVSTDEFVICEKIGGGDTVAIACKKENRDLKLIPFGCVAAHISSSDTLEFNVLKGRAFTFLPLPITTGLPVHLNGYFELSANRRDLWWGLDMHGVGMSYR